MDFEKLDKGKQLKVLDTLSKHVTPSRWSQMNEVAHDRTRYLTLILEDVYQAHNAAAVVRSCEGLGLQDIHVIENRNKLDLKDSTVSKGADKWVSVHRYNQKGQNNTEICFKKLKNQGYKIVATTLSENSITVEELPLDKPLAICIGTEKEGITKTASDLADVHVKLPMYGFVQSYNLSVTTALVLYSLVIRLRKSNIDWQLSDKEKRELIFQWLQKCVEHWQKILNAM